MQFFLPGGWYAQIALFHGELAEAQKNIGKGVITLILSLLLKFMFTLLRKMVF